ncbi:arsenic resistance protein [Nocardioides aurantiacus]|uniref:ACR3 family arsenite efflux pump ArsB n=1 Tax=Nocardioides aurantiacus TaxID=86796 RepID=A0A3N2CXB5_9ACTN|nr:bile acid:sodium symporter [Nocardioides aurantiacus]ROR91854.1 ACR3 family arsenite efflux pump ArsB [Nocardioides aurantiacus]
MRLLETAEKHQIALYLAAIGAAFAFGVFTPETTGEAIEHAIEPVLAALLFATFLQVPFLDLAASLRDARFLAAVLVLNFVLGPAVVLVLVQLLPSDQAILVGVLLVLLTPCIDYVIVFTDVAGGSAEHLVAAAPLLMLLQLLLLPIYLYLFVGPGLAEVVDPKPFVRAFVVLVAVPLTLAALTQGLASRFTAARTLETVMAALMVPLMMATLFAVVASQISDITSRFADVAAIVPIYLTWFVVMAGIGTVVGHAFKLDPPRSIALTFSGATRNSLVVLPLALALPEEYSLAAIVVVTQTLVELIAMISYTRAVPRLTVTR